MVKYAHFSRLQSPFLVITTCWLRGVVLLIASSSSRCALPVSKVPSCVQVPDALLVAPVQRVLRRPQVVHTLMRANLQRRVQERHRHGALRLPLGDERAYDVSLEAHSIVLEQFLRGET